MVGKHLSPHQTWSLGFTRFFKTEETPLIFAAFFSSCVAIPQVSTGRHLHARPCAVSEGGLVRSH